MIKVNCSQYFYYLSIAKIDDFTRPFINATILSGLGREFVTLKNAQDYAFKDLNYSIDGVDFVANLNTHLLPNDIIKFLALHGYALNVNINKIVKISELNQVFNFSQHASTCRGLPQIYAKTERGRVISAVGSLGKDNIFTGVVEFENF